MKYRHPWAPTICVHCKLSAGDHLNNRCLLVPARYRAMTKREYRFWRNVQLGGLHDGV